MCCTTSDTPLRTRVARPSPSHPTSTFQRQLARLHFPHIVFLSIFLLTIFHQVLFKSIQSLANFFHLALLTAPSFFVPDLCAKYEHKTVSCALSSSCTNPFRIAFRCDSTTPSSLRLLLNVCTCTDPHVPPKDDQFDCPSCALSFCLLCYFFKAFDQDIMLSSRTRLAEGRRRFRQGRGSKWTCDLVFID